MARSQRVVGTLGEQAAAQELESQGYRVLHRNYRVRAGEIDLVCEQDGILVFCEVKTRTGERFGPPEEAVTFAKRRRIRRLAAEYLQREPARAGRIRFDVVAVRVSDGRVRGLRHIMDAF